MMQKVTRIRHQMTIRRLKTGTKLVEKLLKTNFKETKLGQIK